MNNCMDIYNKIVNSEEYKERQALIAEITDKKVIWEVNDIVDSYGLVTEQMSPVAVAQKIGADLGDVFRAFVLLTYDEKVAFRTVFVCSKCENQVIDYSIPGSKSYIKGCRNCNTPIENSENVSVFVTITKGYKEHLIKHLNDEFVKVAKKLIGQADNMKDMVASYNAMKSNFEYYKLPFPEEVKTLFKEKTNEPKFTAICDMLGITWD